MLSAHLASTSSWKDFTNEHHGKSYLSPDLENISHSARDYLRSLHDRDIRVPMNDPPWSTETIMKCAEQGPHPSTNLFHDFL